MSNPIIIGTRGSELALWQANFTKDLLESHGIGVELKIIKTKGDKIQHLSFDKIEGKGFFTKELEDALSSGEIDLAVHSYKDMPTSHVPGLTIAANSYRENPVDILLIREESADENTYLNVKQNAVTGTSSARRKSQVRLLRPDLKIKDIRGNVPTRIQKLRDGQFDAIILAKAGVNRIEIDLKGLKVVEFNPLDFIPAPAQGVLAYQIRENDAHMQKVVGKIHDHAVEDTTVVERRVLQLFQGGCQMPVGVYCIKENETYHLWVAKAQNWDKIPARIYLQGKNGQQLAKLAVDKLQHIQPKSVFISRDVNSGSTFHKILSEHHFSITGKSLVDFEPLDAGKLPETDWIFFSSKKGIEYFFYQKQSIPTHVKYACIGEATAMHLKQNFGITADFTGHLSETESITEEFIQIAKNQTVVFPMPSNSQETVIKTAGNRIAAIPYIVYNNTPLKDVPKQKEDVLIFTSPLNASTYLASHAIAPTQHVIAIGTTTASKLHELKIENVRIPYRSKEMYLADVIFGL